MIKRAVRAVIPGSGKVWCKHSATVAKLVEEGRDLVKRGNFSQAPDLLRPGESKRRA